MSRARRSGVKIHLAKQWFPPPPAPRCAAQIQMPSRACRRVAGGRWRAELTKRLGELPQVWTRRKRQRRIAKPAQVLKPGCRRPPAERLRKRAAPSRLKK